MFCQVHGIILEDGCPKRCESHFEGPYMPWSPFYNYQCRFLVPDEEIQYFCLHKGELLDKNGCRDCDRDD